MPIVPSSPIEISGSLVPFGSKSGVIVKADFGVALGLAGTLTASNNVTIAVVIKIAPKQRRAKLTERNGFLFIDALSVLMGRIVQHAQVERTPKVAKILSQD